MRPSPHVLAAASSLTGAFVGAAVALQLGVVQVAGSTSATPAQPVPPAVAPAEDVRGAGADSGPVPRRRLRERRATVEALGLLHRWDARRERAWARGDVAQLAGLYAPRSAAGRRDVALLQRYAARGWSVEEMTPRVLDARVELRRDRRVRLRLTEDYPAVRVHVQGDLGAATRTHAGHDPRTHTRVVTLVRASTTWRVERVAAG